AEARGEDRETDREAQRAARLLGEALVEGRPGGQEAPREADDHPPEELRGEPRCGDQEYQADPLPEPDLEEAQLEERRRQPLRQGTPAELVVERGDRGNGARGDLPHRGAARLRHALYQDLDRAGGRLDRAERVAQRGEAVLGVTLGLIAQAIEVDPERAVEDDVELARQLGAPGCPDALRELAEVQVFGGPRVVSLAAGV